jgi:hypothetical protein
MKFRVASQWSGGQFQVKKGTTVLATVNVPNTGGWQTWTTISTTVTLTAGVQTVRLQSMNTSSWNINWLEIIQGNAATTGTTTTAPTTSSISIANGTVLMNTNLSANPNSAAALGIYPNPAVDRFLLDVNNTLTGAIRIQIVNMNGNMVRQQIIQKTGPSARVNINITGLQPGHYTVHALMNGWSTSTHLIKQ